MRLRTTYLPSFICCFISILSTSAVRPETSMTLGTSIPSRTNRNPFAAAESSGSASPMGSRPFQWWCGLLVDEADAARELGQLEDDELRRLDRRDADLADDLPGVDAFGRVGLEVALDEVRLVGRESEQGPLAPLVDEEGADRAVDPRPELGVVRLEDHPLRPEQDGLLEVVEELADVEIAPGRVARQGAGTPDADGTPWERADAVDADGVEQVVLG